MSKRLLFAINKLSNKKNCSISVEKAISLESCVSFALLIKEIEYVSYIILSNNAGATN